MNTENYDRLLPYPMDKGCLPGLDFVNRYWDSQRGVWAIKLLPGQHYFAFDGELLVATLGSCMVLCLEDPVTRIGAMVHFALPAMRDPWSTDATQQALDYGNEAIQLTLSGLLRGGAVRRRLRAHLVGGMRSRDLLGEATDTFVERVLDEEQIIIARRSIGGSLPKKVHFFPHTGRCAVAHLPIFSEVIGERDREYFDELASQWFTPRTASEVRGPTDPEPPHPN